MKLLTDYLSLQQQLFDYFGYVQDWRVLPMYDCRGVYWAIIGGEAHGGTVRYSETEAGVRNEEGDYYSSAIYTNRHLPKWVYRGKDYTLICVDTECDGNQLLQIFENRLEIKDLEDRL